MSQKLSSIQVQTGMAGALAMAAGSAAYGVIVPVTPPANLPNVAATGTAGPLNWDVNGDAIADFAFSFRNPQAAGTGVQWQANMNPTPSGAINAVAGYLGPFINYGSNLNLNDPVGPALPGGVSWRNTAQVTLGSFYRSGSTVMPYGGFATGAVPASSVVRGYVGFRFSIGGLTRYGWLDVEVRGASAAAGSGGIYFFGAAYEDSGAAIGAGQIPAPGSIGALALGAVACLRRSRRAS
jgi:hypothetical protein